MLDGIAETPVSAAVCAICVAYWLYLWNRRVEFEAVAFSYRKVVHDGERWRIITATFAHIEILHLLFNLYSLWGCRSVEAALGSFFYFKTTCILIVRAPLAPLFSPSFSAFPVSWQFHAPAVA